MMLNFFPTLKAGLRPLEAYEFSYQQSKEEKVKPSSICLDEQTTISENFGVRYYDCFHQLDIFVEGLQILVTELFFFFLFMTLPSQILVREFFYRKTCIEIARGKNKKPLAWIEGQIYVS